MTRLDRAVPNVVTDPELVAIAQQQMSDEIASCSLCQSGWLPRHFRTVVRNGAIYQQPCGSNSRVFDPSIPGFVGYEHCTCDLCW